MKQAALLLLGGCSTIFGLSSPQHAIDATATDAAPADTTDATLDIPDAAPGHCVTQADCPNSVCLPTTVCAPETDVAWLSSNGVLLGGCTKAQPCVRMADALSTMKPYIRVIGTITNLSSISRDVQIFGEPGAGFSGNVQLNSGAVGLYSLSFTGGTCIQNQGATATIEHCVIHDCTSLGINSNGPLTLDGSTVTNCRNGGVVIQNQTFTITNNFITQNGGGMTGDGGLTIQPTLAATGSRIDFNTIASNGIKSSTTGTAGGVFCDIAGFTLVGDVVVHNTVNGSTSAGNANKGGQCTYATSFVQPIDNIGFVSTAANNYHITAQSPLRDVPGVATTLATDVDGESRPYGSGYDVGADEYHP
ncbi:MAG TPA: right-handed parallel beta-helix repeat-containing protein [Kofleriaceae bacterium]|nr:right-handed parallel beta-helix repeat-containing protein [Kofleriaceae bacterium]